MKNKLIAILKLFFLSSCFLSEPMKHQRIFLTKGENYCYQNKYTSLDTLINIDGYYSQWIDIYINEKEKTYLNYYNWIFYKNGLVFHYLSGGKPLELSEKEKTKFYSSGDWGTYKIHHDTIKIRFLTFGYHDAYGEHWYKIIDSTHLKYIGFMNNSNVMEERDWSIAAYTPNDVILYPNKSWLLNKKWFWCDEEKYKQWKEK